MIAISLAVVDSLILIAAGILHVYWASGGMWGFEHAIPQQEPEPGDSSIGEPAFRPHRIVTRAVGMVCFVAAGLLLTRVGIVELPVQGKFVEYGLWLLAGFFLLRTIGDFRFAGLTRRVKDTTFARWDARLFTPLFLWLGVSTVIVNLLV